MRKISREYSILFNAITDIENDLARIRARLIKTQQDVEEAYINDDENDDERGRSYINAFAARPLRSAQPPFAFSRVNSLSASRSREARVVKLFPPSRISWN